MGFPLQCKRAQLRIKKRTHLMSYMAGKRGCRLLNLQQCHIPFSYVAPNVATPHPKKNLISRHWTTNITLKLWKWRSSLSPCLSSLYVADRDYGNRLEQILTASNKRRFFTFSFSLPIIVDEIDKSSFPFCPLSCWFLTRIKKERLFRRNPLLW